MVKFNYFHGWPAQQMSHSNHSTYPLVICYVAIENDPVEIVDFPSYNMVDLSSFPVRYGTVYQAGSHLVTLFFGHNSGVSQKITGAEPW